MLATVQRRSSPVAHVAGNDSAHNALMNADATTPRRAIRVLVLTDIVDSTSLVERLGDLAASELFAEVDRLTRDLLRAHGGQEIRRSRCERACTWAR